MKTYSIGLLTFFLAVISHAENAVGISVSALPPTSFFWDQPDRAFALIVGVVAVAITFQQAIFRKHPAKLARVNVTKD